MEITKILAELRTERGRVEQAIAALEALEGNSQPTASVKPAIAPKSRRRLSAAGRRRIAEAARKRWAAVKAANKPAKAISQKAPAKKQVRKPMSAVAKRRLSELAKKRWAAKKAAAAKP